LVSVCVFGTENSLRGKILSVKYYYYLWGDFIETQLPRWVCQNSGREYKGEGTCAEAFLKSSHTFFWFIKWCQDVGDVWALVAHMAQSSIMIVFPPLQGTHHLIHFCNFNRNSSFVPDVGCFEFVFCSTGDGTQGLTHVGQVLHPLSYIPRP
jgi:hypothetical protein